ncbi:DUF2189 domain-containing protein [Thiolinea disciformis]|uniref:DUF2189 domain-containing protein n=1 Tax=Thiolinea disciformis TaxID=125614 RepID=UPI00036B63BA|nr:DUF2189 domain-containing protein [Thiolinea disciformis]
MEQYDAKYVIDAPAPAVDLLFTSQEVQTVAPHAVSRWLSQGWQDFQQNRSASLTYGVIFAIVGLVLNWIGIKYPAAGVATTSGFLILGPFLALGLYELSRQSEQGKTISFMESTQAMKHNKFGLGIYAFVLMLVMIFWICAAVIVVGIFSQNFNLQQDTYTGLLQSLFGSGPTFVLSFFGMGFVFAVLAYITGVVTVPMLLDRKVDIVTAMNTSMRAVAKNPATLAFWAAVIVALIGIGILTFYIGLIITMPLVAHASWHAYRDLVK